MYDRIAGVKPDAVGEGTHFRIPWLQSPNVMDIRTRPRTISSVTGTKGVHELCMHRTEKPWARPAAPAASGCWHLPPVRAML